MDFVQGVDSGKTTLIQSASNPNGLRRDQMAWLVNATVRGGGITQRPTWKKLTEIIPGPHEEGLLLWQGGILYEPENGLPYLISSVGGKILKTDLVEGGLTTDLTNLYGPEFAPSLDNHYYFCQGEIFLVIQDGSGSQNPIFWYDDGTNQLLRFSKGFQGVGHADNEIPSAGPMDYYQGRLWYALGRTYTAGDIVGGPSGTNVIPTFFNRTDSILHVTENPLAIGGDGFTVPSNAGNIRALAHAAVLDTTLGVTPLFVFTRSAIYGLSVPQTRADWTSTTDPQQRIMQKKWGAVSDRSIAAVNGDLYYQTLEPAIRSLFLSLRYSNQFGNTPISRNENRLLLFNDRSLMALGSGMLFDNRIWQTSGPFNTPVGVASKYVAPLDFDIISSFQDKLAGSQMPAWEGVYDGLDILQLMSTDYGGVERGFAVVSSRTKTAIELWELTQGDRFENGDNRVEWQAETPAYDCGDNTQFKELMGANIGIDRLFGTVDFTAYYRTDFDPCWYFWAKWQKCSARNSCEDLVDPVCASGRQDYNPSYAMPMTLPHPPRDCASRGDRPAFQGRFFQVKLIIKGFTRIRSIEIITQKLERPVYQSLVC